MKFKLISFPTCPFVQRAVIVLLEKKVPYTVRYVKDLENPPDWFKKISPRERVPVLVADSVSIFESQAICEFLDEVTPEPKLMPTDPVQRARERAWFAYAAEELIYPAYSFAYGTTEDAVTKSCDQILEMVHRLDGEMNGREFLSGDGTRFGMADIAMAPFLYRASWLKEHEWLDVLSPNPDINQWTKRILSRTAVQKSVPGDFDKLSLASMQSHGSWILENNLPEIS